MSGAVVDQRQRCAECAEPLLKTSRENGLMRILQDMVSETARRLPLHHKLT
jgi:uncharacterized protein with PIN domain